MSYDDFIMNIDGTIRYQPRVDTTGMMIPVRCTRCRDGVYDLTKVEVTGRYSDCSMWTTPCCRVSVDDRPDWSTGRRCYEEIQR